MKRRITFLLVVMTLFIAACSTLNSPTSPNGQEPALEAGELPSLSPVATAQSLIGSDQASTANENQTSQPSSAGTEEIVSPTISIAGQAESIISYGYTNQRADGNRFVNGSGNLQESEIIDIPLAGVPVWLVSARAGIQSSGVPSVIWAVMLENGSTQTFLLKNGQISELSSPRPQGEPNPFLLRVTGEEADILISPAGGSQLSPPAVIDAEGNLAYISETGDLVFQRPDGTDYDRLEIDALPDSRILVDEKQRLLLLTNPTSRYEHGVLGDELEASAITLAETNPEPSIIRTIQIQEPRVIEGIAPLWSDITGDGIREIIVTQSDRSRGAQIVVYSEEGEIVAAGPVIGTGFRWRHQLAVAPFGENGEVEIVDVLTPHIGGVVEFFRMVGDELVAAAQLPGYSSHVLGSRNLDMAVAADFDRDGNIELILPNQSRNELAAVRHGPGGAEAVWTLPLGSRISSNLSAVSIDDELMLGAGLDNGTLRIWQ